MGPALSLLPRNAPNRALFVGNLGDDVRDATLRSTYRRYGQIEKIDLRPSGSSHAFVVFMTSAAASAALAATQGTKIGSKRVWLDYGKHRSSPTVCRAYASTRRCKRGESCSQWHK